MDTYAVIGNPIHHSLSPRIHQLFAQQTQQHLHYTTIHVELGALPQALAQFQSQQGKGLNITAPFKQQAFHLVNHHSERAICAQAVNTIIFEKNGNRIGDNTDGIGLLLDLKQNHAITLTNKKILILGAGGAVRGVLEMLLNEKPSLLVIANRDENKARQLANEFQDFSVLQVSSLSEIKDNTFDLIINGTSPGLLALPENLCHQKTCCYDMTYGKGLIPFLQWGKNQGAETCYDGLGMLVEQAAEAFYLWRNIRPDTKPILKLLLGG
jgi:shikimate dehydrogenase